MSAQKKYSYDSENEKLAEYYLAAGDDRYTEEDRQDLAQAIQDAIESWLADWESKDQRKPRP